MLLQRLSLLLLSPLALTAALEAQATPALLAFGDSLSDNGNQFELTGTPASPYWRGRYSNGPVWVERMAPKLGVPSPLVQNWAVGGATSSDVLNAQVLPYLAGIDAVPEGTLVTVWAGANDLIDLLDDPNQDPNQLIGDAIGNLAAAITLLVQAGAEDIVVVNLPDLSLTPGVTELNDPTALVLANILSVAFNAELAAALLQIEAGLKVDLIEIDAFDILHEAVDTGLDRGFVNVTEKAYDSATGTVAPDDARYVFWDEIHPTSLAHRVFAGVVLRELGVL